MKSRFKELIDKAIAATVSAIEIYNKPDFRYRGETFCILAINGWELLFKAKWLYENNNKIHSLYERYADKKKDGTKSKKMKIKRTHSGNPRTYSLEYLAKKFVAQKHLDQNAWANIQALLELRHSSVHFYNSSRDFSNKLQEIGTASIRNFVKLVEEWFERDLSEFNFFLMPLSFLELPTHTKAIVSNNEERNFLNYLTQLETHAEARDSQYSVTINLEVKLIRSKTNEALGVRIVDSTNTNAPEIRMTEEQILEQYPWDYQKLIGKCKERYSDFKRNRAFHKVKTNICEDKKEAVCKIRYLDPKKPKSGDKTFYKPEILIEFDKHYTKRSQ
ncbi:MAG: DUF3644 domain-containing protein [Candidatus Poribacteria bacterium]|nr:DUF3644 domain-containing protein [Candidatus Poribacteria bacterium]